MKRRLHSYDVREISLVRNPDIKRKLAVIKSSDKAVDKGAPIPALDNAPNQDPAVVQGELDQRAQDTLKAVARLLAPHRDQITGQQLLAVAQAIGLSDGVDTSDPLDSDGENVDGGEDIGSDLDAAVDAGDAADDDEPDLTGGPDEGNGDEEEEYAEDDADEKSDSGDDDATDPLVGHVKGNLSKPANVKDSDHAAALDHAKSKYLEKLKGQGYNLKPKSSAKPIPPQGKNPMKKDAVTKSQGGFDWTQFDAGQREQLEPVFKSFNDLAGENKTLIEKAAELEGKVRAMEDAAETKALSERLGEFSHLGDHDKLLKIAKSLSGDAREEYFASLKATDNQFAVIKKSGGDLFAETGSRTGGESPMNNGSPSAEHQLNELASNYVAKSSEKLTHEQAYDLVLKTAEGRKLYAQAERERLGR